MQLGKKILGAVAVVVCTALALSGCGSSASSSGDGNATLRVMLWGTDTDVKSIKDAAAGFQKANPKIKFDWESGDCAIDYAKCKTLVAGNNMPDVVVAGSWVYNQAAANGVLADLNPYIEKSKLNTNDFTPSVVEALKTTKNGHLYGLPMGYNIQSLYYNKTMFDKAGLKYPPADGSYTYNDLREWAKKLTLDSSGHSAADAEFNAKDIKQYGYYNKAVGEAEAGYGPVISAFGGGILTGQKRNKCEADSSGTIAGFQWLQDVMWKDHSAITPQLDQEEQGDGRWVRGEIAMQQGSHEQVPAVHAQNPGLKFGMAALPKGPAGNASMMQIHIWAMSNSSQQKDASYKFIEYMSTKGAGKQMGLVPAYKNLAQGKDFAEAEGEPSGLIESQIKPANWKQTYVNVDPSLVWTSVDSADGLRPALEDIFMNRKSAKQALTGVCKAKIDPIFNAAAK